MKIKKIVSCLVVFSLLTLMLGNISAVLSYGGNQNDVIDGDTNYIVICKKELNDEELIANISDDKYFYLIKGDSIQKYISMGVVESFEIDRSVELIDLDCENAISSRPELFSDSEEKWDLDMIGFDAAEEADILGQGVTVGVIDSGVLSEHEDLAANIIPGHNYLDDSDNTNDNIGHGTAVSGVIAAELNGKGINGVAPKCKIVPLKCFEKGVDTYDSEIIKAIMGGVDDYKCDVLNISAGLTYSTKALKETVEYAISKNVIIVSAAGNNYNILGKILYYPASYDGVISVGAVDDGMRVINMSQRNNKVLISAPGNMVLTTNNEGKYSRWTGTSFATPIITGVVADLLSADKNLKNDDVIDILSYSVNDRGEVGRDINYGYGIVNMKAIINYLTTDKECALFTRKQADNTWNFYLKNVCNDTVSGKLCICVYNDKKRLIDLNMRDISLEKGNKYEFNLPVKDGKFKCFILNNSLYSDANVYIVENN